MTRVKQGKRIKRVIKAEPHVSLGPICLDWFVLGEKQGYRLGWADAQESRNQDELNQLSAMAADLERGE